MITLESISRSPELAPPRVVVHGPHGIGKTTFACAAPGAILLPVEDGWGLLDVPRFPNVSTWGEVMEAIAALYQGEHEFSSLAVDSLDWLEPLVWAETCKRHDKPDIEAFGYGKGYLAACDVWREFFAGLAALRTDRGMGVVLIAHSEIKRFDDPNTEPYDRYQIKLQPRAAALVEEWADAVLFANWRTFVAKADAGFNNKVTRGVGTGERLLHTEERPGYRAKNRYNLPPEMPLSWGAFSAALAANLPAADAA